MTTKKNKLANVSTNPVYDAMAEATEEQIPGQMAVDIEGNITTEKPKKRGRKDRKTYTKAEATAALESMQTSGKKGVKLPRINLAFTPSNYEFIKIMAQVRGQNLTEFINDMIEEARTNHDDVYQKAIEFRNSL